MSAVQSRGLGRRAARLALKRIDPTFPYRAERRTRMHTAEPDDTLAWTRAPAATATYSLAWQLLGVALILSASYFWMLDGDPSSTFGTVVIALLGVGVALFGFGNGLEIPRYVEAYRRREWKLLLTGLGGINIVRGLEYAFGTRPNAPRPYAIEPEHPRNQQ